MGHLGGAMPTPKAECELLMSAARPLAQKMLRERGGFHPYGAAMKEDGEIVDVAGDDGRGQRPAGDIIHSLKQEFVQGAREGRYKATALVSDVNITLPSSGRKSN